MPLGEQLYLSDVTTVKRYGNRYKLTFSRRYRNSGVEPPTPPKLKDPNAPPARFENNLSRSRSTVYELSMCNPWEYFCTFTLADDRGFDRHDLSAWHKDFAQWLRNLRRNHGGSFSYVIVPETHKDGAWHLHALMSGIPDKLLRRFTATERLPYKLLEKVRSGDVVYEWVGYRDKYGWGCVEAVRDHDRCASYITKYVTKALSESSLAACKHLFFSSHGLKRAELISKGYMHHPSDYPWDYKNDYVSVKWSDSNIWEDCEILEHRCKPHKSIGEIRDDLADVAYSAEERFGFREFDCPPADDGSGFEIIEANYFAVSDVFLPASLRSDAVYSQLSLGAFV